MGHPVRTYDSGIMIYNAGLLTISSQQLLVRFRVTSNFFQRVGELIRVSPSFVIGRKTEHAMKVRNHVT